MRKVKLFGGGEGCLLGMTTITALLLAVALACAFCGCTTTRYVPVEHHTTDTLKVTKYERDSVWLHDSVLVRQKGDTVFMERWHDRYRDVLRYDTLYQARVDSIPVPYEVVRYKEPIIRDRLWQYGISTLIAALVLLLVRLGLRKLFP